jgi:hypothetical protein
MLKNCIDKESKKWMNIYLEILEIYDLFGTLNKQLLINSIIIFK